MWSMIQRIVSDPIVYAILAIVYAAFYSDTNAIIKGSIVCMDLLSPFVDETLYPNQKEVVLTGLVIVYIMRGVICIVVIAYLIRRYHCLRPVRPHYIVAFDFETLGAWYTKYNTVALGISVLKDGVELSHTTVNGYRKGDVIEPRCLDQFWKTRMHLLEQFEVPSVTTVADIEFNMISTLVETVQKCYVGAVDEHGVGQFDVDIVTDRSLFDGAIVNHFINKYNERLATEFRAFRAVKDGFYPLPYSWVKPGVFDMDHVKDTSHFMEGLLASQDALFVKQTDSDWAQVSSIWDVPRHPEVDKMHPTPNPHHPAWDAFSIARQWHFLNEIKQKRVGKRLLVSRLVRRCMS